MKPTAFFRQASVRRLLERAAQAAATPLSIHVVRRNEEGLPIFSTGGCETCLLVSSLPEGRRACRASRRQAVSAALRRKTPVPFVCHLGFACVSARAILADTAAFALTFGPYCPAEASEGLDDEVRQGLAALEEPDIDPDAVSLEDVAVLPPGAVYATAAWTSESLAALWEHAQAGGETSLPGPDIDLEQVPAGRSGKSNTPPADPYHSADIAAALAGGDQPLARSIVRAAIAETPPGKRAPLPLRRARAVAAVAASLEAASRARLDTAGAWDAFGRFVEAAGQAHNAKELVDAAMRVLGIVKRRSGKTGKADPELAILIEYVTRHLDAPLTLAEVAKAAGLRPTAVTHRLQRRFGLSFSQYLGKLRIHRAKALLRETGLDIAEVAHRVGIRDRSNFARLFRRFEQCSPREYRDRHRSR